MISPVAALAQNFQDQVSTNNVVQYADDIPSK